MLVRFVAVCFALAILGFLLALGVDPASAFSIGAVALVVVGVIALAKRRR